MKSAVLLILGLILFVVSNQPVFASEQEKSADVQQGNTQSSQSDVGALFLIYPGVSYAGSIALASHIGHLSTPELFIAPLVSYFVSPAILMKTVYRNRQKPNGPPSGKRRLLAMTLHAGATISLTTCYASLRALVGH